MPKHIQTRGIITGAVSLTKRIELEAGSETNIDEPIAANATNREVALVVDISQLKSLFILADGDLTLATNNSGTPVNTIALVADKPFLWAFGDAPMLDTEGDPITTDITKIFATNAAADAVRLQIFALVDPTF